MTKKLKKFLIIIQFPLLYISYYFFFLLKVFIKKVDFVIGTDEIARNIFQLGKLLNNSITVCLKKNKFYNLKYDHFLNIKNKYLLHFYLIFYGPILLGYLVNKGDIFVYIWSKGYLYNRNFEFKFLKSKNKKIICIFLGRDIKSLKLKMDFMKKQNLDTQENYFDESFNDEYDFEKKEIAASADSYADLIFNHSTDNKSYIKSKNHHFRLSFDKNDVINNNQKFPFSKIKILHAPSRMISKGTPLVRAAIKKLQLEGYNFDYIELSNKENCIVLEELKQAHIVLNQFYSFTPGLFGVEALANNCAVLMSADPKVEWSDIQSEIDQNILIQNSKDAWLITKYWQVYDNLKFLLDNPNKIKHYADNGYKFFCKYYTVEAASNYLNEVIKKNNIF